MSADLWRAIQHEMHPDGSLRDIYVRGDSAIWARVLRAAPQTYPCRVFIDGEADARTIESFGEAAEIKKAQSVRLKLDVGEGVTAHTHFFDEEELEFDIDPKEVRSARHFEGLLSFLRWLASTSGRAVFLTHENQPQLRILAVAPDGVVQVLAGEDSRTRS